MVFDFQNLIMENKKNLIKNYIMSLFTSRHENIGKFIQTWNSVPTQLTASGKTKTTTSKLIRLYNGKA